MRLGCMSGGRKRRSNRRTMRGGQQCGNHRCFPGAGGRRKRTNRRGNRRGNRVLHNFMRAEEDEGL